MSPIRVLLADDHTLVRKGLRSLLDAEPDIAVLDEAADGQQALTLARRLRPDVVLMDFSMPGLNGLEATRQLQRDLPEVRVLILTVHANEEYIFQVLRAGAAGYLVKQAAVEELIAAIRAVARGETYLSAAISPAAVEAYRRQAEASLTGPALKNAGGAPLTRRETQVLQLIADGRTHREIAAALGVSVKTVEAHRAHILEKTGVRSTAELVRYALREGLINP